MASDSDGAGQRWHDFSAVDAVLCVRASSATANVERKPATRLINAWVAGCVPLAERDPGYLELGVDGTDVFFIDSPPDALAVIDRLNADGGELARVEGRIRERAAAFGTAVTLERWRDALVEAAETGRGGAAAPFGAVRAAAARASLESAARLDSLVGRARRALASTRSRRTRT